MHTQLEWDATLVLLLLLSFFFPLGTSGRNNRHLITNAGAKGRAAAETLNDKRAVFARNPFLHISLYRFNIYIYTLRNTGPVVETVSNKR